MVTYIELGCKQHSRGRVSGTYPCHDVRIALQYKLLRGKRVIHFGWAVALEGWSERAEVVPKEAVIKELNCSCVCLFEECEGQSVEDQRGCY